MEKDLFNPIKSYFESYGYICDGEVNDIDLYMEKDNISVAVELKQTLDFKSLQQASLRQKISDIVYIGIFRPRDLNSRSFKDKIYILKRLGIGLIVVSKKTLDIEIVSEPIVSELSLFQKRNQNKKVMLSAEFQKRKIKQNTGGVTGKPILTSYKEDSLLVLDALIQLDNQATTKQIRELSGVKKTTDILYHNYYGWFSHVDKGVYKVMDSGLEAYNMYLDIIHKMKK